MINTSPVLVSYIKYLTAILSRLVTVVHQTSKKLSKDTINSRDQEKNKKQLTATVEENNNVLCKVNAVQKVLLTNMWHITGTSEGDWKTCQYNHTKSFRSLKYSKEAT